MDHKRFLEIFYEFSEKLEEQHTLYLDCISGFLNINSFVENKQKKLISLINHPEISSSLFQDQCGILYEEICGKDLTAIGRKPIMRQGEVKKRTEQDGKNYQLIGAQCLVSLYTYWDVYLRKEIAYALNIRVEDVKSDLWGDLRLLRNSILHRDGKALDEIKKCKILRWFTPGEPIILDFEKMQQIFIQLGIYRNLLHKNSFPIRPIKISANS